MRFDRNAFDREVGKRIQLHRKRRGYTQEALAEGIGISRATFANLESGRQRVPLDVVWRAAVVLDVPLSALAPEPLRAVGSRILIGPESGVFTTSASVATMTKGLAEVVGSADHDG